MKTAQKTTILYVDDEKEARDLIEAIISGEFDEYEFITASCLEDAKEKFVENLGKIDCVVCDYYLTGQTTGIDFLSYIRDDLNNVRFPFILLTGSGNEEIAESTTKYCATDYMQKRDFSMEAFRSILDRVDIRVKEHRQLNNNMLHNESINILPYIVDNIPTGILVVDEDGKIHLINKPLNTYINNLNSENSTEKITKENLIDLAQNIFENESKFLELVNRKKSVDEQETLKTKENNTISIFDFPDSAFEKDLRIFLFYNIK